MKPKIAVSACLLGINCKYNGGNNYNAEVIAFSQKYELIPICPESSGGLEIPRLPAEIKNGRVFLKDGTDVTEKFQKGAQISLETALKNGCTAAVLKARSPSCGSNGVYSGNFDKTLVLGDGITAALFKLNNIPVYTEEELNELI